VGTKSERVEWEIKEKLHPSSAFFNLLYGFIFLFFCLKKKDARRKHLKQKGRSGRVKAGPKSEKVERELEGKLPPFFAFLFFSMVVFSLFCFVLFCLRRARCQEKTFET
jgi:hypothetical protein